MRTIFQGDPLETARSAAVTAVRFLWRIPTGHKG
jgi:hypothetical protein